VRNEAVLHRVKTWNILSKIKREKAKWIGHILHKNCLLKHMTEGKIQGGIEGNIKRRMRRKRLLDDLKEMRG
jgi:hypothetical protein